MRRILVAYFSAGGTNRLIDAGISARRVCAFLAGEGLTPQELDGVLVTLEKLFPE